MPRHRNAITDACSGSLILCAGVGCPYSISGAEDSNGDRSKRNVVKYRCPVANCIARYCSVACCKSHKTVVHSAITATISDGEGQRSITAAVAAARPEATASNDDVTAQRPISTFVDSVAILSELQKQRLAHDSKILHMLGSKRLRQQISLVDHGNEHGGGGGGSELVHKAASADSHGDHRTKMLQTLRHSDAEFNSFIESLLETVREQR